LAAFRQAAAVGAHMVELDVQLTRDAQVVVIHDVTLERTTDGTGPVRDHTLAELRGLDAGGWFDRRFRGERVPTLGEVLAELALPVNVELKPCGDDGLEDQALAVVLAAGALGRVVFSSFERASLERLRALAPDARLAVLWETEPIADALSAAERVAARALHLRKDAATARSVAAAAAANLPVCAWTANDPAEFDHLAAAGVEGVFTDYPERFLQSR
jgi:glycerophosphoryl diester phosphodiesterase